MSFGNVSLLFRTIVPNLGVPYITGTEQTSPPAFDVKTNGATYASEMSIRRAPMCKSNNFRSLSTCSFAGATHSSLHSFPSLGPSHADGLELGRRTAACDVEYGQDSRSPAGDGARTGRKRGVEPRGGGPRRGRRAGGRSRVSTSGKSPALGAGVHGSGPGSSGPGERPDGCSARRSWGPSRCVTFAGGPPAAVVRP